VKFSGTIVSVVLALLAGVGSSPASAGATKSVSVAGSVDHACSLSATSVGLQVTRTGGTITTSFSPTTVSASCNSSAGGTLGVSSTRLQLSTFPNTKVDYTLSVSGWGTPAITYATSATPPPPATRSNAAAGNVSLSFSCSVGCTSSNIGNNSTYNATIALSMSANP
jgi:hypothetical protein